MNIFLRLWPQSLAGQTIALLLMALLCSHIISFWLFAGERRLALLHEKRESLLTRIASVVRLLEETPPALHERILEATDNDWLHFQLAEYSALDTEVFEKADNHLQQRLLKVFGKKADNRLQQRLLELLGEAYTGKVRVLFAPKAYHKHHHHWDWHWRDKSSQHDDVSQRDRFYRDYYHKHHKPLAFIVAIALNSGQWLNIKIHPLPLPRLLVWSSFISTLIMAIAVTAILIFMIRRITRPLRALTIASDKLGRGEVTPPLPERGPADIRQTTRAFNQMNQRLQRFVQDRTRMLAAMSHDLRTPITTLRLRAEFLEDTDNRRKILATLDEMQAMTEAALAFAREAAAQEDSRRVDLTALVASLCDDLADMGQDVQFTEEQQYPYTCRPVSLKRALRNLIENAVRYGQRARVAINLKPTELHITIDDDGPGIPTEDNERVFEPFVRLETSRNRDTGGIGLGMSIARSILREHGGEVILNNRPTGGLQVTVTLPINN
jgi:signal transduction histidine kinase